MPELEKQGEKFEGTAEQEVMLMPEPGCTDKIAGEELIAFSASAESTAACEQAAREQPKEKPVEIKPLTTLRFFAAFAVVIGHASDSFTCWRGLGERFIVGQAVTFFFVLSGFILTYNYFNLRTKRDAAGFYLARIARIWPAHVCTLSLLLFLIPEVFRIKSSDILLFLGNLFLIQAWIPVWQVFFSYNASSWSISSEMFFYLWFPLMLWGMSRKWYLPLSVSGALLIVLICFANYYHLPEFDPLRLSCQGLLYISPLSMIFNFCAGMTAAFLWRRWLSHLKLNIVLATFLEASALAGVCFMNVSSSAMRYAVVPWVGNAGGYWMQNSGPSILGFALLITIFAMNRGLLSKLFGTSLLVLLGELSFGIYMLHGVLITFWGINFPQQQSLLACLVFTTALFVSAHLMFEIVEKPMRRLIIKRGQPLINFAERMLCKSSAPLKTNAATKIPPHPWRGRAFVFAEAIAFASFIYFCLPTVHLLTSAEARALEENSPVRNVLLSPYLLCRSATASVDGDRVSVVLVWEALKREPVCFTVKAMATDGAGVLLGSTTYTQDGRRTLVDKGACWMERVEVVTGANSSPSAIALTVLRNKHEVLHRGSAEGDFSLLVPVQGTGAGGS